MRRLILILCFIGLGLSGFSQVNRILMYNGKIVTSNSKLIYYNKYDMFQVDASAGAFTQTLTLAGEAGESMRIYWGDGQDTSFIFTGANQNITHDYSVGTYKQKWSVNRLDVTYISAASQNLTGNLPLALQGFYSLTYLALNNNSFAGDLSSWSSELSKWTNITVFRIYFNNLTGDLSSWSALSTWASITDFRIYNNSFTGDLSSWSALSTWTNVNLFYLYNNSFTGDLSSWSTLSTWDNIAIFRINNNSFTGLSATQTTAIFTYNASANAVTSTAQIDNLFSDFNTYFTSNTPVKNLTVDVSGGTNASPTGGAANTDITNLQSIFTTAGYTFTAIIN